MSRRKGLIIIIFIISLVAFLFSGIRYYATLDREAPVISVDRETIEISVKADEAEILRGVTAKDGVDGDVTSTLSVEKISKIDNGMREVTLVAFDRRGNTARAVRNIKYKDYTHPRFYLEGPLRANLASGIGYATAFVRASDCIDGDITSKISFEYERPEEDSRAGDFPISIEVTNSAGDRQTINATVSMYQQNIENQTPQLALTEYIVYTPKGTAINPFDYFEGISYYGRKYVFKNGEGSFGSDNAGDGFTIGRSSVYVSDEVNYDEPGSYEIKYSVTDSEGVEGSVRLIVVVEED